MKFMISCKDAAEYASRLADEELSFYERLKCSFHMIICALCRQYAKQVLFVNRLFKLRCASMEKDACLTEKDKKKIV